MRKTAQTTSTLPLVALILAWLVPGAGHIYLRRYTRGIIIMITIAATFWGGVAMGGVLTVDYYNARWWFVGDMLTGVHGLCGWYRQKLVYDPILKDLKPLYPNLNEKQREDAFYASLDEALAREKVAIDSPCDNIARSYAGVAGMLNLLCIVDALFLSLMGQIGEPKPLQAEDTGKTKDTTAR